MNIAIVGGGISGLATAFQIRQLQPQWAITIFEREPHLGGTMRTVERDGFLFETGSNGFLSNKPFTLDLVRDSGAGDLLLQSNDAARIRYVYTDALHRLPDNPKAFLSTGLLSAGGKLRVLAEVLIPRRREEAEESLQSFGYRRVGRQFTDVFLDAMSAGIFASTPERLSVNAAFPAVVRLEREHGGLFRGMIAKRKKEAGPGGVLMSFSGGVSRFIEHLGGSLDADIRTGCAVHAVHAIDGGYRLATDQGEHACDQVVMATPAYASADIVSPLDGELASALQAIDYSPIAVVGFGYDNLDHPLNGFGLLTTSSAGEEILGVLWDSAIFPDRAPPGKKSVRVMIGGQRQPELALKSEAELIAMARRGIHRTMGVGDEPAVTFVQRWARGIPSYEVGHLDKVDHIFARAEAFPGLHLNSNAYRGIGINDCVENSLVCARDIASPSGAGDQQ